MAEARSTTIEETIRQVVREEVRAALEEHIPRIAPAEPKPPPSPLLTVEQVAERCHAKPKTVREWIRSGRLQARKAGGRRYLVALADLERFLLSGASDGAGATVAGEVERIREQLGLVASGH